jgi:predicted hydrocarbon binding protein
MYFCSFGIPGWFSAALELSGGKQVNVKETECVHRGGKRCEWSATWV